jgi:hypothetical protein
MGTSLAEGFTLGTPPLPTAGTMPRNPPESVGEKAFQEWGFAIQVTCPWDRMFVGNLKVGPADHRIPEGFTSGDGQGPMPAGLSRIPAIRHRPCTSRGRPGALPDHTFPIRRSIPGGVLERAAALPGCTSPVRRCEALPLKEVPCEI